MHKKGVLHVGDDGVTRSLGPDNEVLGFVAASPAILARYIAEAPEDRQEHLKSAWSGVDGRDVPEPWVLKREIIPPSRMTTTKRREVLNAGDIVLRDLSVALHKRTCSTAGNKCQHANPDCINFEAPSDDCTCLIVDRGYGQCAQP